MIRALHSVDPVVKRLQGVCIDVEAYVDCNIADMPVVVQKNVRSSFSVDFNNICTTVAARRLSAHDYAHILLGLIILFLDSFYLRLHYATQSMIDLMLKTILSMQIMSAWPELRKANDISMIP